MKFETKDGTAQVKNDLKEHRFEMLGMLREFHWYCAGSRERVANDVNNRLEWYCGGDAAPDATNQEWASGPLATRAVVVTRPTTNSPAISWKFESYK